MAMAYFRKVKAKNKKGYTWSFTIDIGTGKRKQITRRGFESFYFYFLRKSDR